MNEHARAPIDLGVVTANFPSREFPAQGTFVRSFAAAAAALGNRVTVIHPVSLLDRRKGRLPSDEPQECLGRGSLRVRRPRYVSTSARWIGRFNTASITQRAFQAAVRRSLAGMEQRPDLVYGHFLYPAGFSAVCTASELLTPGVIGVGEGTMWSAEPRGFERAGNELRDASGFVAVSSAVARNLVETLGVPAGRIRVFPNGTDRGVFHPRPRDAARRRWGLDPERFLVAFAGRFEEEKGLHRLLEAVQGLPEVGLLLAGSGSLKPAGPQVLLAGPIAHGDVPDLLSAADAFVLPTRVEGCSNAVIEAMACGLPVVTSRGAFMDDLVDDASSLRVDPESVGEIREAIRTLSRDRGLAGRMGEAALARATRFCVFERTKAILEWATALPPAGRRGSRVHDRPVKSER